MFGDIVREHRRRVAATQEELAGRARISPRALRDIEAGRVRPRQTTVRLLAEALGLAGADLETFIRAAYGSLDQTAARSEQRRARPAYQVAGPFLDRQLHVNQRGLLPGWYGPGNH